MAEAGREGRGLDPGEKIGKYRLDRVIGAGGMGIVWAAFDPDLERSVAIKLLRADGGEATLRSRLLREARAMARLKHPNVLTVYEVGTDQNRDYIAMELVDGESLDLWLAGRPPREQVMAALLAAGLGLAAAHDAGLVHRDFKPHNVLRSKSGHVYVTDFGLARGNIEEGVEVEHLPVAAIPDPQASGLRRPLDSLLDSPLTQTGVLIGTPAYMAPEQFAGRVPDARSDQFAFSVTAWEALTGARPFGGATLPELERSAAAGQRANEADLPLAVRDVLARGLDPAPVRRWPDLPSLLAALSAATAPPARTARMSARRWAIVGGIVASAAGVSIALSVVSSRRGGAEDVGACGEPEEAFGDAWSDARRDAVTRAHRGGDAVGAIVLLDAARRSWLEAYDDACDQPASNRRVAELACLTRARDAIGDVTAGIAREGSDIPMGKLALLSVDIDRCDPDSDRDPVDLDGFIPPDVDPPDVDLPDVDPPDVNPPTPPTPARPRAPRPAR